MSGGTEESGFEPETAPEFDRTPFAAAAITATGARIREAREAAGLTQEALGAALDVTQTAVSYWEAGKRDPGIADLLRIAEALRVPAASLLPVPEPKSLAEASEDMLPAIEPPLPDGEYARVEIMGHDFHTGWVTEGNRAGQPVMVIRDWDGFVIAEVPGHSLYRYVPLATPLKRPESQPRRALSAGWNAYRDDEDDEGSPF